MEVRIYEADKSIKEPLEERGADILYYRKNENGSVDIVIENVIAIEDYKEGSKNLKPSGVVMKFKGSENWCSLFNTEYTILTVKGTEGKWK